MFPNTEKFLELTQKFNCGILQIESEHISFFENNEPLTNIYPVDRLVNHFVIIYESTYAKLKFHNKSNLNDIIKEKVVLLFDSVWNQKVE